MSIRKRGAEPRAFSAAAVAQRLRERLPGFPDVGLVVALSGGVDSVALLAALAQLRASNPQGLPRLRAVHVDHGLSPRSRDWARWCARLCRGLDVPIAVRRVTVPRGRRLSLEASARGVRYAALRGALRRGEVLLTAHHLDDQFETLLLQLLRGAGVAGLAGIVVEGELSGRRLLRPLLDFRRGDLERFVRDCGLAWVDDESNADARFDRNYLRHRVVPAIEARWPGAARVAVRSAEHLAAARDIVEELAREDLARVARRDALDLAALSRLPSARRAHALRAWLAGCGLPPPDSRHVASLLHEMPAVRADANPALEWPGAVVRRYRGVLYCETVAAGSRRRDGGRSSGRGALCVDGAAERTWDARRQLHLGAGLGCLVLRRDPRGEIAASDVRAGLSVRFAGAGERVRARGSARPIRLAERLRASGVLPWRRASVPLLFQGGICLAVAGVPDALGPAGQDAPPRARSQRGGRRAQACYRLEWRDGPRVLVERFSR